MAKKKSYSELSDYKIPPTTYAVQTAETILRGYGVKFSQQEVVYQLMDNKSFYKKLLQVPAISVYNDYLLRQCRDMQFYCAEQVVNILFASCNLKAANPEGNTPISEQRQQEIFNIQNANNDYDAELNTIYDEQFKLLDQAQQFSKTAINDWQQLINETTDKIIAKLMELGFTLSASFPEKLKQRLNKRGADIGIANDVLTQYHIREQLTGIERAIIGTLLEEMQYA